MTPEDPRLQAKPLASCESATASPAKRTLRSVLRRLQAAADRSGKDWLIFNPVLMRQFHRISAQDSAALVRSFGRVFPQAERYVDVGSGAGAHSAELQRRGYRVCACERSRLGRWMARRQGIESQPFDLRREPPSDLPQNFDVAFCFEVAQYVPAELSQPLVRFIAGLAPTIAFTAAGPGQTGSGFINVQDQGYWMGLFSAEGASKDKGATEALRSAFVEEGVWAPWLIRNIIVFRRDRGSGSSAIRP